MHLPKLLTSWTYKTVKKYHTSSLLPNVVRPQGGPIVIVFVLLVSHLPSPLQVSFHSCLPAYGLLVISICVSNFLNEHIKDSLIKTVGDITKVVLMMTDRTAQNNLKDLSNGTDLEIPFSQR